MKKLLLIVLALSFFVILPNVFAQEWWNTDWNYRKQLNITNQDSEILKKYHTIDFTIDTASLISEGKLDNKCEGLRIVYNNEELDMTIWDSSLDMLGIFNGCNDANTKIYFMLQKDIVSGSSDTYYVYYGNPSTSKYPNDLEKVFLLYDDFSWGSEGVSVEGLHGWDAHDNIFTVIVDGSIRIKPNDGYNSVYKNFTILGNSSLPNPVGLDIYWDNKVYEPTSGEEYFGVYNGTVNADKWKGWYWYAFSVDYQDSQGDLGVMYWKVPYQSYIKMSASNEISRNNYYRFRGIWRPDGDWLIYKNDSKIAWSVKNITDFAPSNTTTGIGYFFSKGKQYLDNILVRRYINIQPTITLSSENAFSKIDSEYISPSTPPNNTIQNLTTLLVNVSILSFYHGNYIFYVNDSVEEIGSFPVGITQINLSKSSLSDGIYSYYIWMNNTGGGEQETEKRFITIDNTPPVLSNSKPKNNGFFNNPSSVLFQINLTEENFNVSQGVNFYWRRHDVGSWKPNKAVCYGNAPSYTCNKTVDVSEYIGPTGDVLDFFFNTTDVIDHKGELGNEFNPLTATVDKTIPTSPQNVAFESDPYSNYDNDKILGVNWTSASDSISGIKEYKIYVSENNSAYVYKGTNTSSTGYQFTGSEATNYSVNVTAVDLADNENTTGTISSTTIRVDTLAPKITIIVPRNITYTSSIVSLVVDIEPHDWSGYSLDGQKNITFEVETIITGLSNNTHHLIVYANDSAGNMGYSEVYFTVNIIFPVITILSPANNSHYHKMYVPLNFTIDKPTAWIGYSLDNQSNKTIPGPVNISNVTGSTYPVSSGSHSIVVYANDSSNNMGSSDRVYFFYCPADITHDKKVDVADVARVSSAFGSFPGHPKWNETYDMNNDNKTDITDVAFVSSKFGKVC